MRTTLAALLVFFLCTLVRGAPDDAAATTEWASADGRVSLRLPAAWDVTVASDDQTVLTLRVALPGGAERGYVEVFHLPGMRSERAQPHAEKKQHSDFYQATSAETRLEPMPHLLLDCGVKGKPWRHAYLYRIIERNGFTVHGLFSTADWGQVGPALFAATKSLSSKYGEWPARPEGYRALVRDGYEYLLHKAVKDKDVDALHKLVLEREAAYAKLHGPVPKPDSNRPVIVVHAKKEDAAPLLADAAAADFGCKFQKLEARLFTVPLPKPTPDSSAELARELNDLFQYQSFGWLPSWVYVMDRDAAQFEAYTGKPVPWIYEGWLATASKKVRPFDQLVSKQSFTPEEGHELFIYCALFRAGGKPWRDAYAAFWKELAATGDCEAAQKILLALDQKQLQSAAETFAAKEFKPVKVR
jgi:hypothetical protein